MWPFQPFFFLVWSRFNRKWGRFGLGPFSIGAVLTGNRLKPIVDMLTATGSHGHIMFPEARGAMTDFWREHSQEASLEEMMLDTNAQELTKHELPEILSYLPTWEGKDVLELGAGIG